MSEKKRPDITISLDMGGYDEADLLDVIVKKMAEKMIRRHSNETQTDMQRAARAIFDEKISEAVTPLIDAALKKAVQQTNSYGEARGEPVTLSELIIKEALDGLLQGKERGGYGSKRSTLVQQMINEEVTRKWKDEISTEAAKVKVEVAKAIREHGGEVLAKLALDLGRATR